MMQALDQPPYYAFEISAHSKTFPCPAITLGGLRVNENDAGVLDNSGRNIPGLYAAGRAAVGIASNGYVSGTFRWLTASVGPARRRGALCK